MSSERSSKSTFLLAGSLTLFSMAAPALAQQNLTDSNEQESAISDPNAVPLIVDEYYETTDGTARIGIILARDAGNVSFRYCDGAVEQIAADAVQASEADCSSEPGGPPDGIWAWDVKGGEYFLTQTSGDSTIACEELSAAVREAVNEVVFDANASATGATDDLSNPSNGGNTRPDQLPENSPATECVGSERVQLIDLGEVQLGEEDEAMPTVGIVYE